MPLSLHASIKIKAYQNGQTMNNLILQKLNKR